MYARKSESDDKLTVLQVGTLNKPIRPDQGYCPVETVIYNIDKGLLSAGHRSIVACSADSRTMGEKYVTVRRSSGDYCREDSPGWEERLQTHLTQSLRRTMVGDIDIVHLHEWVQHLYDGRFHPPLPIVVTLHVPAAQSGLDRIYEKRNPSGLPPSVSFIAISEHQKREYSKLVNISRVIHHGVDVQAFPASTSSTRDSYLFMIGRVTRDKGQDRAIELARRTGSKLILAGYVQNKSEDEAFFESLKGSIDLRIDLGKLEVRGDYYRSVIKPLLECDKQVIFVGQLDGEAKKQWYQHARATLFPIRWGEPFGLVAIESLACGTPVLAMKMGALPEIVTDGETGFLVDSLEGMIASLDRLSTIDRQACRRDAERRFSIARMARDYIDVYRQVSQEHRLTRHLLSESQPA